MKSVIRFNKIGEAIQVQGKMLKLATCNELHIIEEGKQTKYYDMGINLKCLPIEVSMDNNIISLSVTM